MAIRGQRFHVDLSSEDETDAAKLPKLAFTAGTASSLVGDVKERSFSSSSRPPSLPENKSAETGFPAHKNRTRPSAFKRSRVGPSPSINKPVRSTALESSSNENGISDITMGKGDSTKTEEAQAIDEENKQRIANMSPKEIEEARNELLTGLSPSLIERLLKKANIEEGKTPDIESQPTPSPNQVFNPETPPRKVAFDIPSPPSIRKPTPSHTGPQYPDPDLAPLIPPPDLQPASSPSAPPKPLTTHLQPPAPTLDPSSPSFLSDLHETYFPSLPHNPSALAWMAPASDPQSPSSSPYSPTLTSLPPSALRFDFRAHLLPPRLAAQIPLSKGLHHHASAPDAAGYTIPELAHLSRSALASQRCVAFQTLGRLLYRLGRGDFGPEGDDLREGLWGLVDKGKVLDMLMAEAGRGEGGNRSCWVTATEAVWLWRKGGGRRWKAE